METESLNLEDQLFETLTLTLREQNRLDEEIGAVKKAYEYAYQKHEGQFRKNEEKYIVHPVNVAMILAEIPVDTPTICAALLHDVLEDTDATPEEIRKLFGQDVLTIVEGVTKLGKFQFESTEERNAENFRKMFLAMANDVRVVLLKLADRLHNMRTLEHLKREKQVKIARETLEVFSPLANRMGMGKWRVELEDLSFQFLDPEEYERLRNQVEGSKQEWEDSIREMQERLGEGIQNLKLAVKIYGRVKNYFSIYRKMQRLHKQIQDVYDLGALRIIVESEKECYEALGVVHSAYRPIPGRFKDYIAMPKSNLYRSLHTSVIGPAGKPIEVQIRTQEMHRIAEYGIAAHWRYKESGESVSAISAEEQKLSWLKQMLELKEASNDAQEYVDNVKLDLFRDEVFVFTPRGDLFDLPQGATSVDFAYRIHTQVGNACTGSMVNGRIVPLDYQLRNGDIVEIITSKKATPKLDWIKFVQTPHARTCIRQWYKKNFKENHIEQGKTLLEAELTRATLDEMMKTGKMQEIAHQLNYTKVDDIFLALGYGELSLPRVINRLKKEQEKQREKETVTPLESLANPNEYIKRKHTRKEEIEGLQGMLYHLAKCCGPLPGDAIVGVVTRSRGVMIHRDDCNNLSHVNDQRMMQIHWTTSTPAEGRKKNLHSIRMEVHVIDRVGIFKDVLARIADTNTNVTSARSKMLPNNTAIIEVGVDIHDLDHLEKVRRTIAKISDVISVTRTQVRQLRKKSGTLEE
jgi:GTP diphosphokinase / guanosine-3',5'-bis(diphosphate) 3'-diphosphatase